MKRIKLLFVILFTISLLSANAQNGKKKIVVNYFTSASKTIQKSHVVAVRNQVISGIQTMNRVILIDVEAEASLKVEEERRASENAMADQTARIGEMKRLGANHMLTGNIESITTEKIKNEESNTYFYSANVLFSIKIVNIEDGAILASKSINVGGILAPNGDTPEEAISKCISTISKKMKDFVDKHYALAGKIVELKEHKKDKLKSCYINLGRANGVQIGQYIQVLEVKTIGGSEIESEVGVMKVVEVVSDAMSTCNVTKGAKEILAAFKSGSELRVKTIKAKDPFGLNAIKESAVDMMK